MILHIKRCENKKLSTIKAITMSLVRALLHLSALLNEKCKLNNVGFFNERPKFATAYEIM